LFSYFWLKFVKVKVENPVAFRFIMQDDLYLLKNEEIVHISPVTPEPVAEIPPVIFNYLGKLKKSFLIITHYTNHDFIDPNHLTSLENILKRKELAIDDVAIFNIAAHNSIDHSQIRDHFKPQKMLLLGQKATPAGLTDLTINLTKAFNDCAILYTFSFDEMMDDTDKKKAFWEQVKQL
jgi:hypothetical protein